VFGDFGGGETPVPFPNTEVKPSSADGTVGVTRWESRSLPSVLISPATRKGGGTYTFTDEVSRTARPRQSYTVLTGAGRLVRGFRDFLGVKLPPRSVQFFGTRAQVSVEGTVNGQPFRGLAFPSADGTHFLNLNATMRKVLAISEGDRVEFIIGRRAPAAVHVMPRELARALASEPGARNWWAHLHAGQRRTALRFIGGAKSADVRSWRVSDVLRRAKRYFQGEGPFYPTKEDQPFLSRGSGHRG
jgi:hypothetical protein